jgi:Protein of unknown function (DUF2510)
VSANPGWYPDPGGGQGLFRYWDGKAWSSAVSPNPSAPAPSQGLVGGGTPQQGGQPDGQGGQPGYGQSPYGQDYGSNAYANYQELEKKKSPIGWWIAGAALVLVIVVVAVLAIRAVTGDDTGTTGGGPATQPSQDACPPEISASPEPPPPFPPADGRIHGGPVSYPMLGPPWGPPQGDSRVPFGSDVQSQDVVLENNYDGNGALWIAQVLVGELQAGDGFFTPEQGSQIVVKCILGRFYGDNPVKSDVKVNEKTTIDGHEAWLVESHLTFDIAGLKTKGELLIVAIVSAGNRSGLFYASIPDSTPGLQVDGGKLVQPARDALKNLQVDG